MDGYVIIKTNLDTKNFEKQISEVEDKLDTLEQEYEALKSAKPFDGQDEILKKYASDIEKTKNKLVDLYKKQNNITKTDFSGIQKSIDGVGKEVTKVTTKIGKWALAIFGIRSAYSLIRNSMSTLSQYDEQLATNTEYIRYMLASTLKPIIEYLVNLTYRLLTYLNYIAQSWFNVNLFANASTKEFEKQNKALGKSVKLAKELQRAGFDEMNILQDTSSSSGASGGGAMPNFPTMENVPIPEWLEWIKDHGQEVISVILGLTAALFGLKMGLDPIMSLGLGLLVAGLVYAISNLIKFLNDPTFENFTNTILGIGVAVTGLGLIFASLPLIIAGAVIAIVTLIIQNYEKIVSLFDSALNWLEGPFKKRMHDLFGPLGDFVTQVIVSVVRVGKNLFENFYGGIRQVVQGIVKLFKGDFKGGIKEVFSGLVSVMLAPFNALIAAINEIIKGMNKIKFDVPDWVPGIGGKSWGLNIPTIPQVKLRKGTIVNNPGRGVPTPGISNGVFAEAGREAYLPLDDTSLLRDLGSEIGKTVTINLTAPIYLGNKMVAKEFRKMFADSDFARNV